MRGHIRAARKKAVAIKELYHLKFMFKYYENKFIYFSITLFILQSCQTPASVPFASNEFEIVSCKVVVKF